MISGKPRLVARSSLKNTSAQIVSAKPNGDLVLASAHSRELVQKYNWQAATGNIPAAYLTGLLCGLEAKAKGVTEAILDLGLVAPTKGAKAFAVLSGVVDAGVKVPHDEAKIVKDRLRGDHIAKYAKSLGSPEEYAPFFSEYIAKKIAPEKFGEHFAFVKADILSAFGLGPKPEAKKPEKVEKHEEPAKKPAEKPDGKPVEKPAEKIAKKPVEKATEKLAEKPVEKPVKKPAEPEKTVAKTPKIAAKAPAKKTKGKAAGAKASEKTEAKPPKPAKAAKPKTTKSAKTERKKE